MIIKQFVVYGYESNCFVVVCPETGETLIVDPGIFLPGVAGYLDSGERQLKCVFITHNHYDHMGGVDAFVERYQVPVLSARGDLGGKYGVKIVDDEEIELGRLRGRFLFIPGHSNDSFCLQLENAVFTGDALFAGSIGGTPSPLTKQLLVEGLREKVLGLPDETRIYPGHGPQTTVHIEKTANPFFVPDAPSQS